MEHYLGCRFLRSFAQKLLLLGSGIPKECFILVGDFADDSTLKNVSYFAYAIHTSLALVHSSNTDTFKFEVLEHRSKVAIGMNALA